MKVLKFAHILKATPNECLELRTLCRLSSKIPNSCGCYEEEEGLHAI